MTTTCECGAVGADDECQYPCNAPTEGATVTPADTLAAATIVRAKALTTTPSQQLVRIWFDVKDIQQQTDAGTVVFGYRMSRRSHAKGALYVIPGATPDSILAAVGGAK